MDYNKLIADLKEDAEWAAANEWETPIMLSDHLKQAVEAIEQLQAEHGKAHARLCEWCSVCPTNKRNPETCEIANIGAVVNCKDCCADCQFIGCDRSGQCDMYVPILKSRRVQNE